MVGEGHHTTALESNCWFELTTQGLFSAEVVDWGLGCCNDGASTERGRVSVRRFQGFKRTGGAFTYFARIIGWAGLDEARLGWVSAGPGRPL